MALDFPETSHNRIDQKKFDDNYAQIDWSVKLKDKDKEDDKDVDNEVLEEKN